MKKLAIAGASVALAAMPVVGVFAAPGTNPSVHTDLININIENVCAFGHTSGEAINVTQVAHTPTTNGAWTSSEDSTTHAKTDTLAVTMVNGTANGNIGTTTLGIYCNNHNGYKITSAFTDGTGTVVTGTGAGNLVGQNTSETIAPGLTETAGEISTTESGWAYKVADAAGYDTSNVADVLDNYGSWSAGVGDIISSANASGSKMTTNTGDYFTITYGAAIDEAQAADTYKGGIKYTLSQL